MVKQYNTELVADFASENGWDVVDHGEDNLHLKSGDYEIKLFDDSKKTGWTVAISDVGWAANSRDDRRRVRVNSSLSSIARVAKVAIQHPSDMVEEEF